MDFLKLDFGRGILYLVAIKTTLRILFFFKSIRISPCHCEYFLEWADFVHTEIQNELYLGKFWGMGGV